MEFAKNIQTSEKVFSFASLYNGNIYLQIRHGCCEKKCQKNYFTKKLLHKLIRSNYRTTLEQEDIILEGHRIRGGPATMLAEINDGEDNDINREIWYRVKRGMEDRKLTSDQVKHLINHAYFSMGTENHRGRCKELMQEAMTLPFDQLSHNIS